VVVQLIGSLGERFDPILLLDGGVAAPLADGVQLYLLRAYQSPVGGRYQRNNGTLLGDDKRCSKQKGQYHPQASWVDGAHHKEDIRNPACWLESNERARMACLVDLDAVP
jgi:hypothetical protein